MATFAERLEEIRRNRDWTKAQMYRAMDIAPGTLANYLSGKNSPNIDTVRAYAERLGVGVGWLAGEEDDRISNLLTPGKSTYADLISILNQVLGVAGFYVDVDTADNEPQTSAVTLVNGCFKTTPDDMTRTMFKSDDSILKEYYRLYETFQEQVRENRVSRREFMEFMEMKRIQLSGRILGTEAFQENARGINNGDN